MKIQGHSKRKTILKSSIIFVLILSIFLSSLSVTLAINIPIPESPIPVEDLELSELAIEWVSNWCEQDPNGNLWICIVPRGSYTTYYLCWFAADVSIYCNDSGNYIYATSKMGFDGVYYHSDNTSVLTDFNEAMYPNNNNDTTVNNIKYYRFNFSAYNSSTFYCSSDFIDNGGDVSANLDLSTFLPPEIIFDVWLTQNNDLIGVTVDFDVATHYNFITLWGYDEFGPTPITYSTNEYRQIHYDMTDRLLTTFYLPIEKIFMYTQGSTFHVSSISCVGWNENTEEQTISLNWDLTNTPGIEYDSPSNTYYYDTFYNESYNYNSDNGAAYAYGHVALTFSTDIHAPVFWDTEETLIQPYAYSFIAIPILGSTRQKFFDENPSILYSLLHSYDVIIVDCSETAFNQFYGNGAFSNFNSNVSDWNAESFILGFNEWYSNHSTPDIHPLPYNLINNKPTHTSTYLAGVFYSHSFYQKSMLYLLGDSNERLLEFETRILGEDGFAQELFKSLKQIYDLQYTSFSDSITYLKKIQYFTNQVIVNDYFGKMVTGIISLDASINQLESSFSSSLTSTNGLLERINESILGLDLSFENITLQFPEFNFDIIVENHPTTNIEYFVDFVNNFFTALPDADFSPLENIETDFSDLFDELHVDDTFDDFLDSLLGDYEFSDSHLSDYD